MSRSYPYRERIRVHSKNQNDTEEKNKRCINILRTTERTYRERMIESDVYRSHIARNVREERDVQVTESGEWERKTYT